MSWQVGDLAVCVDDSPCRNPALVGQPFRIKAGSVLSVVWVGLSSRGTVSLRFEHEPPLNTGMIGWSHERFRKILPDKAEQCEPEFVTLLKRIKPKVSA